MSEIQRTDYAGEYLLEASSGTFCLGLTSVEAVFEFEKRLANRVGKRDSAGIEEGDGANTPTLK